MFFSLKNYNIKVHVQKIFSFRKKKEMNRTENKPMLAELLKEFKSQE
jgi:hypothetical protein